MRIVMQFHFLYYIAFLMHCSILVCVFVFFFNIVYLHILIYSYLFPPIFSETLFLKVNFVLVIGARCVTTVLVTEFLFFYRTSTQAKMQPFPYCPVPFPQPRPGLTTLGAISLSCTFIFRLLRCLPAVVVNFVIQMYIFF